MPDAVTVFALEIVFRQPAYELFAGRYDEVRASVQARTRQLIAELSSPDYKLDKEACRKLEFMSGLVEVQPQPTGKAEQKK
jgi:hypothetical protein